jgi:AraC-like DNA-binding protein
MNYQVYTPSHELQPFVKCFWSLDDDEKKEPVKQRILPDGCMEMIFHYGDRYRQYFEDGSSVIQPRSFVFGQITKYIEIAPIGISGIISARFLPDGISPFIKMPVTQLENRAVALTEVFKDEGNNLEQEVINATRNDDRIKLIETFLLSKLTQQNMIDIITKSCVDIIFQSQGQISMGALAGKMNINRRNMERRFISVVGMSPKQLAKLARLQATLKMLGQKKFNTLTEIAYENGYFDQAHFIKDLKEFTGMNPKSFFTENLMLSALFVGGE